MADLKISQLTAITTLTPATDVLPVVDVTGTTKKITTNQILGSGGTATLASATISGDLTVDTNTLKVVSSTDSIGVGFTPSAWAGGRKAIQIGSPAQVVSSDLTLEIGSNWWHDGTNYKYTANNPACLYAPSNGSHAWYNAPSGFAAGTTIGWNTLMTLNSTGLGVGVSSPLGRLHIVKTGAGIQDVGYFENSQAAAADVGPRASLLGVGSVAMATIESGWNGAANTDAYFAIRTRGSGAVTERLRIDSTGNVGIGVTPINKLQVAASALASIPAAGASGHMFVFGSVPYGLAGGALSSGNSYLQATRWDGTATNYALLLQPNGGNLGFNGLSFGGGSNVIFIGNGTAPSSNPTAGGILYVEAGALKYRGSSGTITTIANA